MSTRENIRLIGRAPLSRELKTSEFSLEMRTCENSDVFNTLDEIYLVVTSKK